MNEDAEKFFQEKIIAELQKRKEIIDEADRVVQLLEKHYQDKKSQVKSADVERNKVVERIYDIIEQKDIIQLDDLFERLR